MGTLQRGQHGDGGGGGGLYRLANISSGLNSSNVCTSDCSPCSFTMGGTSLKTLGGGMSNFLQHFLFFLGGTVLDGGSLLGMTSGRTVSIDIGSLGVVDMMVGTLLDGGSFLGM